MAGHAAPRPGMMMVAVEAAGKCLPGLSQGHSKKAVLSKGDGVEAVFSEGLSDGGERSFQGVDQSQGCVAQGIEPLGRGS